MLTPTVIQKSAWIHLVNGRVLSTRSKGKETYYFPGGKPERGEAPEETLIREIEEELTVSLVPSSITELGIFEGQAHGKPKGT
ncbi:MAG: NUDIX domain-containing protein, partial [Bacteroidota bacterium]